MDTQPEFFPNDLLTHLVGDMAQSLCERGGESQQRQLHRREAAASTIMTFQPRDAVEAMIAGHCVMFHEMIVEGVRDSLRGEEASARRVARSSVVAMDKAFGNNLSRLERYRRDIAKGERSEAASKAKPRLAGNGAATDHRVKLGDDGKSAPGDGASGDGEAASDGDAAAAAGKSNVPPATLNRQARRAIGRQARKHIVSTALTSAIATAARSNVTPNRNAPATTISATAVS